MQRIVPVRDERASGGYAVPVMNRIREIREAAGLTQEELAEMVGTTATHIWRLEQGRTKLTADWMTRLAEALGCSPADLIANVVTAEVKPDVEAVEATAITDAIAHRDLHVYRVIERSVINAGVKPGDTITIDESDQAIGALKGLEIVLVEIGPDKNKVLRQYVPPNLLITNRGGANLAINLEDPTVNPVIVGVVLRPPS